MRIFKNCSERLESKAHRAERQIHNIKMGDERAQCNTAIKSCSRFLEVLK